MKNENRKNISANNKKNNIISYFLFIILLATLIFGMFNLIQNLVTISVIGLIIVYLNLLINNDLKNLLIKKLLGKII